MKSALLKLNTARNSDQEKHQRQMASLQKDLTSAIASSKSADVQAKSQIADMNSDGSSRQSTITQMLTRAKKDLYTLQVERDRLAAQVPDFVVERGRLVLDIASRDMDHDRLERGISELRAENRQALQSKDSLFTRSADVFSSVSAGVPLPPAETPKKVYSPRQKRSLSVSSWSYVLASRKTPPPLQNRSAPVHSTYDATASKRVCLT